MKRKILLPRGYLSPTQVDMWLKSPDRYVRQYIHGGSGISNTGTEFGSKVALREENGQETDDELVNLLATLLPQYAKREHTIQVPYESQYGTFDLLGKMDKFREKPLAFRDTKTGKTTWTQARCEKLIQLKHYSTIIYLKHGSIPDAHLDWAQTEYLEDGSIGLTGRVETFHVSHSMADVLQYLALVSKVARDIEATYKAELQKLA